MSTLQSPRKAAGCLSDFLFDRLMAGDLAGDPAAETARAHLASCSSCQERLAKLEAVEAPSFDSLFARPMERKRRPAAAWAVSAIALAAAAVLMVRVKGNDDLPAGTRTKGALSLDLVVRRPSGEITRPTQGEMVFPGDALRFEVTAAKPGFVAVVGLDATGVVTVYAPASEATLHLEASTPTVLPGSIVVDSTLGPERIVALLCAQPQRLDELRQVALRTLSQAGGDPQRVTALGTACTETSFVIDKRARP